MADILLPASGVEQLGIGDVVGVNPYLKSCCLVIVWFSDGRIVAQHCQDQPYKDDCKIDNSGELAIYITAMKTEGTDRAIKELHNKLKPSKGIYYSHKTNLDFVNPFVTIKENMTYTLDKEIDYEKEELKSVQ